MSKVYREDEWLDADDGSAAVKPGPTRAEAQAKADMDFILGKISLTRWRELSAEFSEPTQWTAAGQRA